MRYGFPMNFLGQPDCLQYDRNAHPSAIEFPSHVDEYIQVESEMKAIHGPYVEPPFGQATHISLFITREKNNSANRRVIVDLSWPVQASVNDFTPKTEYLGTVFRIQLPTVDDFVERLIEIGQGAKMFKIDLSRAFRQMKVDPRDYPNLCLSWQNQYYIDSSVAFGHRIGGMGCIRWTDSFRYLHSKSDFIC